MKKKLDHTKSDTLITRGNKSKIVPTKINKESQKKWEEIEYSKVRRMVESERFKKNK